MLIPSALISYTDPGTQAVWDFKDVMVLHHIHSFSGRNRLCHGNYQIQAVFKFIRVKIIPCSLKEKACGYEPQNGGSIPSGETYSYWLYFENNILAGETGTSLAAPPGQRTLIMEYAEV